MLLTLVLAGKGAKDDVAITIRGDLIADEDAPFEQTCESYPPLRVRVAPCVEDVQPQLHFADTTPQAERCLESKGINNFLACFHGCTKHALKHAISSVGSFHGIRSRCGGKAPPGSGLQVPC